MMLNHWENLHRYGNGTCVHVTNKRTGGNIQQVNAKQLVRRVTQQHEPDQHLPLGQLYFDVISTAGRVAA